MDAAAGADARLACAAGWARAAARELRAAGGAMPWRRLRGALIGRYRRSHGSGASVSDKVLGTCALASIPLCFASREDDVVRLQDDVDCVAALAAEGPLEAPPPRAEPLPVATGKRRRSPSPEAPAPPRKAARPDAEPEAAAAVAEGGARLLKAHVSGLPFSDDEGTLRGFFEKCGAVSGVCLLTTQKGKSRGIAFVVFEDDAGLEACLGLDGSEYRGQVLKVSRARSGGEREPKGGKGKGKAAGRVQEGRPGGKGAASGKGKGDKGKDKGKKGQLPSSLRQFEVFVGGLPYGVSEAVIRQDFGDLGETDRFHMPLGDDGGHSGTAFISYLTQEGMEKALAFNDTEYSGVWIRVQRAGADRRSS